MFLLHKLLLWKFFLWLQSKYIHGMRHGVLIWIFMSGAVYMVMDIIIAGKLNLLKHFILKLFFFKPKNKAIFFKVWALKFILQSVSSNFYLGASFAKLFNFKLSKTCWKSPKLYKRILAHFEKMSLARWFWAF